METRAVKHVARQDDLLIRAIIRVWKAKERSRLLQRVKTLRLLKDAWVVWKNRIQQQNYMKGLTIFAHFRRQADSTKL